LNPRPYSPTGNERAFRNKPTLVKERVVVRHCEATSHKAVAFGLEDSARRTYRGRSLLISKTDCGLHIVCNFGGQAPFRWSFLDSKTRKRNSLSHAWAVAYYERRVKYDNGKWRVGTRVPREQASNATPLKISAYDEPRVAIMEAAGIAPASREASTTASTCVADHSSCPRSCVPLLLRLMP